MKKFVNTFCSLGCAVAVLMPSAAQAQDAPALAELIKLINHYRTAPQSCAPRAAPLASHGALAAVKVATGHFLDQALERAGFAVLHAEAVTITGLPDARAVMETMQRRYCSVLMNPQFSHVGASRNGDSWQVVLAQPAPPSKVLELRGTQPAGREILAAVNVARASARTCGERAFAPAAPVAWNGLLADAALTHSADMAAQRYFKHKGKDGREVADRASAAGYRYRRVGENIAAGYESPDEVVAGWLDSPGHCANIMHPDYTEMGAAYAYNPERESLRVYWTQVFATPR